MNDEEAAFNEAIDASNGEGSSTQGAVGASNDAPTPGMSKNAIKKAAKLARHEAIKPLKRKADKERRKERQHKLTAGYAAGTLTPEEKAIVEARRAKEKLKLQAKKGKGADEDWKGGIVIDLGFDELMSEQEISSMASQLGFLYSANRASPHPFATILHTSASESASPRLWEKLLKANCTNWTRSFWWNEDVEHLTKLIPSQQRDDDAGEPTAGPSLPPALTSEHSLIYLSADSEYELETIKEDEVYIIGGIVDRNRYKNLCQKKAEKLGIKTARLPIGTYLQELPTRKVLTVNQVFQIIVEYQNRQDWRAAFEAVIPARKFSDTKRQKGKNKRRKLASGDDSEQEGNDGVEGDYDDDEEDDEVKDGEQERQLLETAPVDSNLP